MLETLQWKKNRVWLSDCPASLLLVSGTDCEELSKGKKMFKVEERTLEPLHEAFKALRTYLLLLISQQHIIPACFLYGHDEINRIGQSAGHSMIPLELPLFWYVCSPG